MLTARIIILSLFAAAVLAAGGCASKRQAVVTLRFENVRQFTGEDGPTADEWKRISPIVMKRHVRRNRFGLEPEVIPTPLPDPPPGIRLFDYTATIVVADLRELGHLQRELAKLQGQRFAPGRRFHLALDSVDLRYSGSYVQASVTRAISGRTRPGAIVYIFDRPGEPRVVAASETGAWSTPVTIAPGQQYIRGFSVLRGREKSVAARKHFRVDVFTGAHQELTADEFASSGPSLAGRVGEFVGGIFN